MKQFLLLFLLSLAASANAQKLCDYLITEYAETQTTEKTEYSYNEQGLITLETVYNLNNDSWDYKSKRETEYDENGYDASIAYYNWTDGQWEGYSHQTYTHDSDGNVLTSEHSYSWENNEWLEPTLYKYEYTFDDNHNPIVIERYKYNGTEWENYHKDLNTYDENNRLICNVEMYWSYGDWVNSVKYEYSYYDDGMIKEKIQCRFRNNDWLNYNKYIYIYDEKGNRTSYIVYKWNTDWYLFIDNEFENEYDEDGDLLTVTTTYRQDEAADYILHSVANYHYVDAPSGIRTAENAQAIRAAKYIENGRVVITNGDRRYTLSGQMLK